MLQSTPRPTQDLPLLQVSCLTSTWIASYISLCYVQAQLGYTEQIDPRIGPDIRSLGRQTKTFP